ncbi:MAG: class I SAM-dependent methyltransferase [Bifidobacteriaceae bacterium]|jgi:SAM-dependent methyltransferase|nr:class I SAM-dependent methyltransferase [Bifidobacteriaceae bacterium]
MISGYGPVPASQRPDPAVAYWETEAEQYYREHAGSLGTDRLVWCPEGLDESQAHLLGDVAGQRVLEVGCGAAQGARWAAGAGAQVVGIDLSFGMLSVGRRLGSDGFTLAQADAAALPFADSAFDLAFSAFGALPHVPSVADVYAEVARVLRPGGRWVFSTDHPFAWVFPDSPDPAELWVNHSYFDREPYFERAATGELAYTQYHATLADHFTGLSRAGFVVDYLAEPEWTKSAAADAEWTAWSRPRGALVPSTIIIAAHLPESGQAAVKPSS